MCQDKRYKTKINKRTLVMVFFVLAQVYLNETNITSGVKFSCDTGTSNCHVDFAIMAIDSETNSTVFTSEVESCATSQTVQISNLACNKQYSVSAVFAFPNGSLSTCLLSNTAIIYSEDCPTVTLTEAAPTTDIIGKFNSFSATFRRQIMHIFLPVYVGPTTNPILAVIVIPIVLLPIAIIVIIVAVVLINKMKRSREYEPQRAERHQQDIMLSMNSPEEGQQQISHVQQEPCDPESNKDTDSAS